MGFKEYFSLVLYSDNGTSIYTPSTQNESGYGLIYQSIITDDGEYIEENYGVTYKNAESKYDYDSNTGSSTSTTGVEINDTYRIAQTNKTDWFGRTTSDSVSLYNITNEVVDDEGNITTPAQTLTRIETEYSYPVASDGKTTTRLEKFINKTYNGNSTSAYSDGTGWYNVDKKTTTYIKSIVKSMAQFVEKGNIMFYSSSYGHDDIYHAIIVTEVTKTDVKISAHSNPRKNESLIELLKNKNIVSIFAISIRKTAV